MSSERHALEIVDQFTKQAEPFLRRHEGGKQAMLELMAECAEPGAEDTLLDVACGPGIIACFFAKRVAHVTGLDMVPAMLEQAKRLQAEKGLNNIEWVLGQSDSLPFADCAFDRVVTRFSFHHYEVPQVALNEMARVCKEDGVVLVADVTPQVAMQDRFNRWERLRDPSHTRALTLTEMTQLGKNAGLVLERYEHFSLTMDLEELLEGSFPKPGDEEVLRASFEDDVRSGEDRIGVAARREEGRLRLTFPVAVLAWRRGSDAQASLSVLGEKCLSATLFP